MRSQRGLSCLSPHKRRKLLSKLSKLFVLNMKKILFAALICIIALSCEEKSKYAIEREQKEAELKQIRDSLSH